MTSYYPEDPNGPSITLANCYNHAVSLDNVVIGFDYGMWFDETSTITISGHGELLPGEWATIHDLNLKGHERNLDDITVNEPTDNPGLVTQALWMITSMVSKRDLENIDSCHYLARNRVFVDKDGVYFTNRSANNFGISDANEYFSADNGYSIKNLC